MVKVECGPSELMARSFLFALGAVDGTCLTSDSLRVRREFRLDETGREREKRDDHIHIAVLLIH